MPLNAGNDFLSQIDQSREELNLMRTNGPVDPPARVEGPGKVHSRIGQACRADNSSSGEEKSFLPNANQSSWVVLKPFDAAHWRGMTGPSGLRRCMLIGQCPGPQGPGWAIDRTFGPQENALGQST